MSIEIEILISPEKIDDQSVIRKAISEKLGRSDFADFRITKRSIDARHYDIKLHLRVSVYEKGEMIPEEDFSPLAVKDVSGSDKVVIIIGAGPAGLFAALKSIELGMKPVIIERGKEVRERRRDLAALNRNHIVNPDSNYCFGEGGAGTYSDGKLYTRSTKRGDVNSVLNKFIRFGSPADIAVNSHPHIGTNKLPHIIEAMRNYILECGGEVHFNTRMTGIKLRDKLIDFVECADGKIFSGDAYILATGHSARDIFILLDKLKIKIEFKSYALGVRAEHQQGVIDASIYHREQRPDSLPPASYSLVAQIDGRGVYSFCMCPGGIIAPCATAEGEVVTNGWSPSKRNNPWANSGIVVPIYWEDIPEYHHFGALAGMMFQKDVERKCWEAAGRKQSAPAQRMIDFVNDKVSEDLPEVSYKPGIVSVRLDEVLPEFVTSRLRKGFKEFGKKLKDYYSNDAVLVATESRTSSPVRIPRDKELLHHPEVLNLYPCGEGAGYAGGIASAAIDGEKVTSAIFEQLQNRSTE